MAKSCRQQKRVPARQQLVAINPHQACQLMPVQWWATLLSTARVVRQLPLCCKTCQSNKIMHAYIAVCAVNCQRAGGSSTSIAEIKSQKNDQNMLYTTLSLCAVVAA
jgi:hypothetical protein